jgi:hypothetical protein
MVAALLMQQSNGLAIPKTMEFFGFSANETGGHMGRSMMLRELEALVRALPEDADIAAYKTAILDDNLLGKPTYSSRGESFKRLLQLYGLDPSRALFRILRKGVAYDLTALPLIAVTCVFCRDLQLRRSFELINRLQLGESLEPSRMQAHLETEFPGRFSKIMKASMARNVTASWTFAGHLNGKQIKMRAYPSPKPVASMYAMFSGYLTGLRGEMLLNSIFGRLVGAQPSQLIAHLEWAGSMGWLRMRRGGGIMEIDFSPILTAQEQEKLHESV